MDLFVFISENPIWSFLALLLICECVSECIKYIFTKHDN